jgi:hypothetical protein
MLRANGAAVAARSRLTGRAPYAAEPDVGERRPAGASRRSACMPPADGVASAYGTVTPSAADPRLTALGSVSAHMRPTGAARSAPIGLGKFRAMKKLFELLVCFLHPLAVVLMWLDLATRPHMARRWKLAWAIFGLIPLVPFLYVLTGGDLW